MFSEFRALLSVALTCVLFGGSAQADTIFRAKNASDQGAARGMLILMDRLEHLAASPKWTQADRDAGLGRLAMAKKILISMNELAKTLDENAKLELSTEARIAIRSVATKLQAVLTANNFKQQKDFLRGLSQVVADARLRFKDAASGGTLKLKLSSKAREDYGRALEATAGLVDRGLVAAAREEMSNLSLAEEMNRIAVSNNIDIPANPAPAAEAFWDGANDMLVELAWESTESARQVREAAPENKVSDSYAERVSRTARVLTFEKGPALEGKSRDAQALNSLFEVAKAGQAVMPLEKLRILNPRIKCSYLLTEKKIAKEPEPAPAPAPAQDEVRIEIDDGSVPWDNTGVIYIGE